MNVYSVSPVQTAQLTSNFDNNPVNQVFTGFFVAQNPKKHHKITYKRCLNRCTFYCAILCTDLSVSI